MMFWGNGFGWGWTLFGGLMMLLFWGGLIALAILALRAFARSGRVQGSAGKAGIAPLSATPGNNRALALLKERYARGEITRDRYEQMRTDLLG